MMLHQQRAHIRQVLGVRRSSLLLALYVVFYLVYLITGGVVFAALEAPEEKAILSALARTRRTFLETHPCVSGMFRIYFLTKFISAIFHVSSITGLVGPNIFLAHEATETQNLWTGAYVYE